MNGSVTRWFTAAGVIAVVLLLAGCQSSAVLRAGEGAGYLQLQGATLDLREPLGVPAGKARVFIQAGRVTSGGGLFGSFDAYRPHCAFEIERVDHDGFTIEPDAFRITRVQQSVVSVVSSGRVQVAALGLALFDGDRDGSDRFHSGYHLWLASETQPDVRRLTCYGVFARPYELRPPTLAEIDQTLGDIARIER